MKSALDLGHPFIPPIHIKIIIVLWFCALNAGRFLKWLKAITLSLITLKQEHNVFYGHHAKIVCIAWSPDNEHFASGGMDMMVYVWTVSDPETRVKIPGMFASKSLWKLLVCLKIRFRASFLKLRLEASTLLYMFPNWLSFHVNLFYLAKTASYKLCSVRFYYVVTYKI